MKWKYSLQNAGWGIFSQLHASYEQEKQESVKIGGCACGGECKCDCGGECSCAKK